MSRVRDPPPASDKSPAQAGFFISRITPDPGLEVGRGIGGGEFTRPRPENRCPQRRRRPAEAGLPSRHEWRSVVDPCASRRAPRASARRAARRNRARRSGPRRRRARAAAPRSARAARSRASRLLRSFVVLLQVAEAEQTERLDDALVLFEVAELLHVVLVVDLGRVTEHP